MTPEQLISEQVEELRISLLLQSHDKSALAIAAVQMETNRQLASLNSTMQKIENTLAFIADNMRSR